jgi:type I restriction enzyme S subunit
MENLESGIKYVKPKIKKELKGGGAKFEEGDTLFSRITPCLQNGKIAQAKNLKNQPGFGSTEYFVFRGIENMTDTDFIYYLSKSQWFKGTAENSMVGSSGRQRADAGFVRNLKINLPPLKTQRKIASILSGYDDLIENNLKRIKLLEEQAQQTYEEWFVRFKFPGYEDVEIDEVSGLPVGWEKVKLGDLAKVKGGKRLPKGHSLIDVKTNHPYIRVKDLTNGSVDLTSLVYINEQTHLSIKRYIISKDDIYISIAGTVGLVGIIPPIISNANLTENCAKITELENDFLQDYICLFLQSTKGQYHIEARTGGASQPKLALYRVAAIPIILPTKMILEQFSLYSKKIRFSINNLQTQNQHLKEARDILLPRLMSGMIDVDGLEVEGQLGMVAEEREL